jgi:hypothetical protein
MYMLRMHIHGVRLMWGQECVCHHQMRVVVFNTYIVHASMHTCLVCRRASQIILVKRRRHNALSAHVRQPLHHSHHVCA